MKIILNCTDKGVNVEAFMLNHKKGVFLEAAMSNVKLRMTYMKQTKAYVGSMAGLEFVIREENVPEEYRKEWTR
jgi:hypothetical protein